MATPNEGTVGWRFSPKDEELVNYFLRRKINGKDEDVKVIREIDVCKWEPWDLPGHSVLKSDDKEWFFFCPRDQKFPSSSRLNRATRKGYWKATGKDRKVRSKKNEIGIKKTLVFHTGRAPKGKRTYWVMHEYRTTLKELDGTHPGQRPFVICRLFKKDDESVLDATDNDVKLPSLSPIPYKDSPIDLKPELVSHQAGTFAGLDGEKELISAENHKDESCKPPSHDMLYEFDCDTQGYATSSEAKMAQPDVNCYYRELFADADPKNITLFESPMMESMGSSLPPQSAEDSFFINEDLQHDCVNNKHDTSDVIQSIFTNSTDNCKNQGNNWISTDDYEISDYEHLNPYEVPGTDSGSFWKSNSEETELGQLVAELEQYASNAESNGPLQASPSPVSDNAWTSFQELGNLQTCPEYQGGAILGGSGNEHCVVPDGKVSSSHVNPSNSDHVTETGIQIRHRQPQARSAISNFDKHGTAQKRIHLQTNLKRVSSESDQQHKSELEDGSEVKTPVISHKWKDAKEKVTKMPIISVLSHFQPSNLTVSHKLILGLASIATIFVAYAGIHGCLSGRLSSWWWVN
ncbi:unnamed protein product [Rhodiola kirilowii]